MRSGPRRGKAGSAWPSLRHRWIKARAADYDRRIDVEVSLEQIVFVRRRSPDWQGLASYYEAGLPIDPSSYKPEVRVRGFPEDIVGCIRIWNETFPVNFFRCRAVLKEISEHTLRQVRNAIILSEERIDELPGITNGLHSLVFFFDDDDLFAPGMFELLSNVDFSRCDVAVFPLIRLAENIGTFVRPGHPARLVVGERQDFRHRYHTNNYGISKIAVTDHLINMKDHMRASTYADQQEFQDTYFDILISATNKTPCSAQHIGRLPSRSGEYRAFIRRYVESLGRLKIPRELDWLSEPLAATIKLFAESSV